MKQLTCIAIIIAFAYALPANNLAAQSSDKDAKPMEAQAESKADEKSKPSAAKENAKKDKPSPWVFEPNPDLPNVLIIGDSISMGYSLQVRKQLKKHANVYRPTRINERNGKLVPENCQGTTLGLQKIDDWLGDRKWAVIHFNFGLHDLKHVVEPGSSKNSQNPEAPLQATVEQYAKNLEQIVEKLKQTKARLVFATTTPVVPDVKGVPREPDSPPKYNAAALEIMKANKIRVNDLFAFCLPHLSEWQRPRDVHFKRQGSSEFAKQVAKVFREELEIAKNEHSE